MKKGLFAGAASLMLLLNFACSHSLPTETIAVRPQNKVAPKITITDERQNSARSTSSDLDSTDQAPRKKDLSCSTDEDCAAIPVPHDACIPCGDKAEAVRRDYARSVMTKLKDTCLAKFKSKEPECTDFKSSACEEGTCVLVDITKEELQERAKKFAPKQSQGAGAAEQAGRLSNQLNDSDSSWSTPQGYERQYPGAGSNVSRGFGGPGFDQGRGHGNPFAGQGGYGPQGNPFGGQAGFGSQGNPFGGQAGFGSQGNPFGGQAGYGAQGNPFGGGQGGYGSQGWGQPGQGLGAQPSFGGQGGFGGQPWGHTSQGGRGR